MYNLQSIHVVIFGIFYGDCFIFQYWISSNSNLTFFFVLSLIIKLIKESMGKKYNR